MTPTPRPRTEAGKRLLNWLYLNGGAFRTEDRDHIEAAILAIEAEAAHPESAPATSQSPVDLRAALDELEDWKAGRRSWTNLGPYPPYTPDVIAVMDAQEVVKLSAYVQALAATTELLASPDTGVAEEAGPSRTWRLAEGAGLDALPDNACGVMGLCELLKGHEGKHTTSVDRALEGVVHRAALAATPKPAAEGLRPVVWANDDLSRVRVMGGTDSELVTLRDAILAVTPPEPIA